MKYSRKDKREFIAASGEILEILSALDWAASRGSVARDEFMALAKRARKLVVKFGGLNMEGLKIPTGAVWPAPLPSQRPKPKDEVNADDLPPDWWMVDTEDDGKGAGNG